MCGALRCGVLAIVSLSQCAISYGAPVPFLRASAGFWRPVHHDGCNVFLNTPDTHSIHQSYSAQGLSKTFHDVCVSCRQPRLNKIDTPAASPSLSEARRQLLH